LDEIFASKTLGFRELLATVLYARLLDPTFDPRVELYECNPRSLYELDICPVLEELGVPCGKSGPLNIAKATPALNQSWAGQRRPKSTADAVLVVIDDFMDMERDDLLLLAADLGARFISEAVEVQASRNALHPNSSAVKLVAACRALIDFHTHGGAMPQTICGLLLTVEFGYGPGAPVVEGVFDSVSATNKTSNKVGDLSVETDDGEILRIYEVTVKGFGTQRIRECIHSLADFFDDEIPDGTIVLVLCRAEDVPDFARVDSSDSLIGEHEQSGVLFEFIDLYAWIAAKISELPLLQREAFFDALQDFINGPRINTTARVFWKSAFE
jgi:hypothetical protein